MFKKVIASLMLMCPLVTMAGDIDIINSTTTGSKGNTAIIMQELSKELGSDIILTSSCKDSYRKTLATKKALAIQVSGTSALELYNGEQCLPNYSNENVVWVVQSTYYMCRLPANTTTFTTPKVKIGINMDNPIEGWTSEFNRLNKSSVVGVPFKGSSDTVKGILSKDIDWGMLPAAAAKTAMAAGAVCDYTLDNSATALTRKFKVPLETYPVYYELVAFGLTPEETDKVKKVLQQEKFKNFMREAELVEITGNNKHAVFKAWIDTLAKWHNYNPGTTF